MLRDWLDWQHKTVHLKCDGLSDVDAHRAPLPTSPKMSIAGLVSHLTWVEKGWLEGSFLRNVDVLSQGLEDGWEMRGQSLADLLAAYEKQCIRSSQVLGEHQLDELEAYAPPDLELVSLR
ncbi:MAG: hypothetical protein JWN06_1790 [Propionibacteriaceae bacterium]|nr:hypothetical protein [Propionibacteriaceae bacterium]